MSPGTTEIRAAPPIPGGRRPDVRHSTTGCLPHFAHCECDPYRPLWAWPTPARRRGVVRHRHLGWIVASSLATGLAAALLLAAAPLIPAEETAITGAVLGGFALGWDRG